jgi:15-cis-phytoene synthase
MTSAFTVSESYRQVQRISRQSGSNFYRSFWLLPQPKRNAMFALYAFARVTDDLGDSHHPASLRTLWLDWWRQATAMNLISDLADGQIVLPDRWESTSDDVRQQLQYSAAAVLPALRDASIRYQIPSRYLLEIIDGVLADQQKTRFDTYEQVEHYCYLVASAIGLACLHIWEFDQPMPTQEAIDCGLAFQWTNILRDIREDAARGRIYLPRQLYQRHGMEEDDFLQNRRDDRLQCLIREEVHRAEAFYESGWKVYDSLHPDGRPMFSMMWRTYRRLLTRIANDPGAVILRRTKLGRTEKFGLICRHFIPALFRRLPVPPTEISSNPKS